MKERREGILVLADDEYVSIPPTGREKATPKRELEVRYLPLGKLGGGLRLYSPDSPTRDIRVVAVVDALRSNDSRRCLEELLFTHIPVLIIVASTTDLYGNLYKEMVKGPQLPAGRPANLLRLVPSNAAQAWAISSWLRTCLAQGDRVGVVRAEDERHQEALRDPGQHEGGENVYVDDIAKQLRLALEGHGFKAVAARTRGDSLILSRQSRYPDKLAAIICASYPPSDPRRFLDIIGSCTELIILPDAWEPVRMGAIGPAKVWKVFVARAPEDRVKDAIKSIDEALYEEDRRKSFDERRTLTEDKRPRDSLILRIQTELEELVPPAYRFEKGWQNMGFGYELVEM